VIADSALSVHSFIKNRFRKVYSMNIVHPILLVLLVAAMPSSARASLNVDAQQHGGHAGASSSTFIETVRQATEQFDWNPRVSCEGQ
jgi:hypothetical protein